MTSILDVARKAKVAPSTVSLVINRSDNVSSHTRRRVESAISQLGYVPRPNRRRKKSGKVEAPAGNPRHIAIVYTQDAVSNGHLTALCRKWVRGIRHVIGPSSDHLSVLGGHNHVENDRLFLDILKAGEIDGVVIFGLRSDNGYLEAVLNAGIPAVTINHKPRAEEHACVAVDYRGGGRLAANHLLETDHLNVAMLMPAMTSWISRDIAAGFNDVMRERDAVETTCLDDIGGEEVLADVAQLAKTLLGRVSAVFCGDSIAMNLLNQFEGMGVNVPDDIAIVGCDNISQSSKHGKRLTSIGFDNERIGRLAIKTLLKMLPPVPTLAGASIIVSTVLVQGDTTKVPQSPKSKNCFS